MAAPVHARHLKRLSRAARRINAEFVDEHLKHIFQTWPKSRPAHWQMKIAQMRRCSAREIRSPTSSASATLSTHRHHICERITMRVHLDVSGWHVVRTCAHVVIAEERFVDLGRQDRNARSLDR
jgi:hypothetical protein